MSLVENNVLLHGFRPRPNSLMLSATALEVIRGLSASDPEASVKTPSVEAFVRAAVAQISNDSLTVIGSPIKPVRQLELTVTGFDSPNALAASWRQSNAEGDPLEELAQKTDADSARLHQYLRNVYAHFDAEPPSADVGFIPANPEFGSADHWYAECKVPRIVLSALISDIEKGLAKDLFVTIKIEPTLCNLEYSLPHEPIVLGILQLGFYGASSPGRTMDIRWTSKREVVTKESRGTIGTDDALGSDGPSLGASTDPSQNVSAVGVTLSQELRRLTYTVRIGFILVLILIALVAVL